MAKYIVTLSVISKPKFVIEADSPEDAEQKMNEWISDGDRLVSVEVECLAQGSVSIDIDGADARPVETSHYPQIN